MRRGAITNQVVIVLTQRDSKQRQADTILMLKGTLRMLKEKTLMPKAGSLMQLVIIRILKDIERKPVQKLLMPKTTTQSQVIRIRQ